jgi:hypothetical protein
LNNASSKMMREGLGCLTIIALAAFMLWLTNLALQRSRSKIAGRLVLPAGAVNRKGAGSWTKKVVGWPGHLALIERACSRLIWAELHEDVRQKDQGGKD